jgi:hypothetical protein
MDPNACLKELVRLAEKMVQDNSVDDENMVHNAIRLAELVLALDTWLCSGGFLPTDWSKK